MLIITVEDDNKLETEDTDTSAAASDTEAEDTDTCDETVKGSKPRYKEEPDDQFETNKLLLPICASGVLALSLFHLSGSTHSPNEKDAEIRIVVSAVASVVGFVSCLTSLKYHKERKKASKIFATVGSEGTATGYVFLLSLFLPSTMVWVPTLVAIISGVMLFV
ncbi:uncharacterized protein LOC110686068 [Chenopodium quinoa]|uniref:uncharacterized protein LOC110686068 n=1 Tax=Chenopodium quinoa TaxID=63459 RepID=UPI000B77F662|nr:uncharacterized protein LOC110686068 [Chenopodium quinoa]